VCGGVLVLGGKKTAPALKAEKTSICNIAKNDLNKFNAQSDDTKIKRFLRRK
jgi:hypothetical protein